MGPEATEEPIWDHWMHGWKEKITVSNLEELAAVIRGLHGVGILYASVS